MVDGDALWSPPQQILYYILGTEILSVFVFQEGGELSRILPAYMLFTPSTLSAQGLWTRVVFAVLCRVRMMWERRERHINFLPMTARDPGGGVLSRGVSVPREHVMSS